MSMPPVTCKTNPHESLMSNLEMERINKLEDIFTISAATPTLFYSDAGCGKAVLVGCLGNSLLLRVSCHTAVTLHTTKKTLLVIRVL